MKAFNLVAKAFLSSSDILFKPSCLVCQSASSQMICHRCVLPESTNSVSNLRCDQCYELIDGGNSCNLCQQETPYYRYSRFLWEYGGNVRDFCIALKYKPSLKLIELAANLISEEIHSLFPALDWDFIIPIPASKIGLKQRGFNHIEVITNKIKSHAELESLVLNKAFRTKSRRRPQVSLSKSARVKGLKSRYILDPRLYERLRGRRILLVDDVSTTGATLQAACIALSKSAPMSIDILTLARSPSWFLHRAELPN